LLAALTAAVSLTFMTIGLPLSGIPLCVGNELLFGGVLARISVGIQFLATVLKRGCAGQTDDRSGARPLMLHGMLLCACSGVAMALSVKMAARDTVRLGVLVAGRLMLASVKVK
jgi:hypothetical protein